MDSRKIVFRETGIFAVGELVFTAIVVGAFALIGKYDTRVLLGALAGYLICVLNFFFMAVMASLAGDRAEQQDVAGGTKLLKASRTYRTLGMGIALVLCGISKKFNLIALVAPLLCMRLVLLVTEFFRKKG